MAQCQGKTKKGAQCKRDAQGGSQFCTIHSDQEVRERTIPEGEEWDRETVMYVALGAAAVGLMLLFRIRR